MDSSRITFMPPLFRGAMNDGWWCGDVYCLQLVSWRFLFLALYPPYLSRGYAGTVQIFGTFSRKTRNSNKAHGYPNYIIRQGMKKALYKSREQTLGPKDNIDKTTSALNKDNIGVVNTYGTHWTHFKTKHWHILLPDYRWNHMGYGMP